MPNVVRLPFGAPDYPPDRDAQGHTFGICHEPPHGVVMTRVEDGKTIANVGQIVTLDGNIHVIPRHDLTTRQKSFLNAAAEDAFFTEPSTESGWVPVMVGDRIGWATSITLTAQLSAGRSAFLPQPGMSAAGRPQLDPA